MTACCSRVPSRLSPWNLSENAPLQSCGKYSEVYLTSSLLIDLSFHFSALNEESLIVIGRAYRVHDTRCPHPGNLTPHYSYCERTVQTSQIVHDGHTTDPSNFV